MSMDGLISGGNFSLLFLVVYQIRLNPGYSGSYLSLLHSYSSYPSFQLSYFHLFSPSSFYMQLALSYTSIHMYCQEKNSRKQYLVCGPTVIVYDSHFYDIISFLHRKSVVSVNSRQWRGIFLLAFLLCCHVTVQSHTHNMT